MDFNDKDTNGMWGLEDEELNLLRDPSNDLSSCIWDDLNENEDTLMSLLEEQTPMKNCIDYSYQVYNVVDNADKMFEECAETLQIKRRRMLQFPSDSDAFEIDDEHFTSTCLNFKAPVGSLMKYGLSADSEWNFQWNSGSQDDSSVLNFEESDQETSKRWPGNRADESEMHCSLNEMDDCMTIDDQVDTADHHNAPEERLMGVLRHTPNPSPIKIIKGGKFTIKASEKLVAPVISPFALIKPCEVKGDITLRDINQKIHGQPPSSSKNMEEDPCSSYPTSAFSGKPVVLKTKIRTEGGKGSITIMRTKG